MTRILVGTPCYDEKLTASYVSSVLQLKEACERATPRVDLDFFLFSHALVAYSRNVFASRMLEHEHYTHLLMIDADMGFPADLVPRMLAFDKDVCASVYPKRALDLDRLINTARAMPEDTPEMRQRAIAAAYEFVCEGDLGFVSEGTERRLNIDRGFVRGTGAGAGIMLIKRRVLEQMLQRYPELVAPSVPGGATTLTKIFFQPFNEYRLEDGHVLSEDLSFCRRWTQDMGGEMWLNVDVGYVHHGTFRHRAGFFDKLLAIASSADIQYDER